MANSGSRVYRHHPLGADFLCFVPCTGGPYCSHADFEKQVVERAGLVLRLGIPRHPAFDPIVHRLLRFAEAEHHLGCVDRRYPDFCLNSGAYSCPSREASGNSGAYSAESIRGAILSIPRGQWEAADSLGMTHGQVLKRIIFPQTVRIALPAVMNDFISLVKSTSLASSITIIEMTMVGQQFASVTYEPLILYMEVAVIYLLISTVLTWIQGKLEIRTSKYLKKA
jgi:hypothetical protein